MFLVTNVLTPSSKKIQKYNHDHHSQHITRRYTGRSFLIENVAKFTDFSGLLLMYVNIVNNAVTGFWMVVARYAANLCQKLLTITFRYLTLVWRKLPPVRTLVHTGSRADTKHFVPLQCFCSPNVLYITPICFSDTNFWWIQEAMFCGGIIDHVTPLPLMPYFFNY